MGNWAGAAMVAGAALGVALIGGALFAFTTMENFDFVQALGMTLMLAVSTFGSNIIGDMGEGDIEATQHIGQYPLLVTVLALGVAVWLFRRTTANYRHYLDAILDAVRAALILMLGVLVLAIVVRIWSPDATGYASGDGDTNGADGLGLVDAEKAFNSIAGAIFITFFLTLTVLAIAVFVRRDWLPAKAQQVNDWLRMPMLGIAAVAATSAVAGLIYLLAIIIGEEDARSFDQIMRLLAVLPALGLRLVSLGVFSNFGIVYKSDGDKEEDLDRLPDFADDNGVLFWIAPLIALAVMVAGVYAIVWKSLDKSKILRHTLVYLGLLIIAIPFMVRFSNAHIGGKQEFDGDTNKYSAWFGMDAFQTTAFFFLFSIVVAAAVLFFTGNLDINSLKGKAQAMSNQFQSQPGQQQWGNQPQGGQWGNQPPQYGGQPGGQPGQQQWGNQPPQQGGQQQWGNQPPQQGGQQQWGNQPPQQGGQQPGQQGWQQQPPSGGQPPYGQQPPQGGQPGGWNPGQ
ncbi:hypothetical protein BJ980_000931 [Nocardioides daedukensis]|uniref:Uncharacterized protein n=1 Tax=Nocardioides daedukensis TaxID=634462 RepID=A0A7Y9S0I7_9ACTN|nr:hypothetical protein [Nocardioides daedukensis]NYG58008.1 hypothetical protein [Nocardioides daedukensis]